MRYLTTLGNRGGVRVLLWLCLLAAGLAAASSALAQPQSLTTEAEDEVAGVVVARHLSDGRVEFGFQPDGGDRILPSARFLPAGPLGDDLQVSSAVTHEGETLGRIVARGVSRGRIEFGFRAEDGETLWPERRFLPAATSGRWLRSSQIRVAFVRDLAPQFVERVGDRTFTDGQTSVALTLPKAESGNGVLSYSLSPEVPGLTFHPQIRQLTGTPTGVADHQMTYRVQDADGDEDVLRFTIRVGDYYVYEDDDGMDEGDAMMGGDELGGGTVGNVGGPPPAGDNTGSAPAMGGGGTVTVTTPRPPGRQQPTPRDTTFVDNPRTGFADTAEDATSTFSLDVDRASYFLALNWANMGYPVDPASVRAEEWTNAFDYGYDAPSADDRFAITTALIEHPAEDGLHLARVAFRPPDLGGAETRPLNVTLVLDASGSMGSGNRVEIARAAAESIRGGLRPVDRIAVVQFSNSVLSEYTVQPTHSEDERVANSLARLRPNSSTNVQAGLDQGLRLAAAMRDERPDAINYLILMSDGVANVDATDPFAILDETGDRDPSNPIRLIAVGVGIENYNDYLLEQLAQHGNGWYRYLDTPEQARSTFGGGNWLALARPFADQTRAQVQWDDNVVARWRLVGYENRVTSDESFTEDRNEFAEIPAGLAVTVFYELELTEAARSNDAALDLGSVSVRWLTSVSGESNEQTARITDRDLDRQERARLQLGAVVALAADRYSGLPSRDAEGAGAVRAELVQLVDELDGLRAQLGSLEAYRDLRFLLHSLIHGLRGNAGSGYSR